MKTVIRHLRRAVLLHEGGGPTDSQLLESFLSRREGAAFEALLRRHGPMVLSVCRRVLRNAHDAEDAFQATFLVLVRKAGSLRSRELLANWLYGVAYRTAMKARAMNAKQRAKEKQASETPRSEACADEELLAKLDHELSRLPDKYRVPVVLCELEGRGRKEVARLLGLPEGTLSWRLAQAKKILARRLSRYGTVAVAALLSGGAAFACLSPALRASTVEAALTAGTIPAKVLALTEGVVKAMLLTKLKITVCFGALMLLTGIGATGLTYRATAQQPGQGVGYGAPSVGRAESRPQADDLEALRLEIEALRKSLQATRERVKALEGEVSALKGQRGGQPGGGASAGGPPGMMGGSMMKMMSSGMTQPSKMAPGMMPPGMSGSGGKRPPSAGVGGGQPPMMPKPSDDLASDLEAALKKLKADPEDKQAIRALERALKHLKEREKSKPPASDSGVPR